MSASRDDLARFLRPRSVAVVGLTDTSPYRAGVLRSVAAGVDVTVVHPTREAVLGLPTHPTLAAIGRPVDAVLCMVGAASVPGVVDQATASGAGGVVVLAGGFADAGEEGRRFQEVLADLAARGGLPVVGPNSAGIIDVVGGADLSLLPPFERRPGRVSLVAQSGAALEAVASVAWRSSQVGFGLMVSSGNEMTLDVADYVRHLAVDPSTEVIALVLEAIRRPAEFFDAVASARRAGKPVVVLKLGRSEQAHRVVESHTGAIAEEDWVFQIAAREAGIEVVPDVQGLVDLVQLFDQLPRGSWPTAPGVCVLTMSGGFAANAADLAATIGLDLPSAPALDAWVRENIPGAGVANPLDATGFAVEDAELWGRILDRYLEEPAFGSFLFLHQLADWDEGFRRIPDVLAARFRDEERPLVISPYAGDPGSWVGALRSDHVAIGNGLAGSLRGLGALARNAAPTESAPAGPSTPPVEEAGAGPGDPSPEASDLLPFAEAMALLDDHGIAVAPFHLIAPSEPVGPPPFPGPYVAKLADVAHRARIGAVRVRVSSEELPAVVADLRAVAAREATPATVVVQPLLSGREVFIGMSAKSSLGPVVATGRGGGGVEHEGRVLGRMAPLSEAARAGLAHEVGELMGLSPDAVCSLEAALGGASALLTGKVGMIETMDINPLIETTEGFVAVDALCFLR